MKYTKEKSQLILLSLLKSYGIKKVVASAGTTNFTLVMSMQNDPWFEMYSSVDERSAAYMACGLAYESGEPVVITCTEATASRNYMPGLTEAYYRKLPVLAITGTHGFNLAYHREPQSIDRMSIPNDVANLQVNIPVCRDENDEWDIIIKLNRALLALSRNGGGPVHINIESKNSREFTVDTLPIVKKIDRYTFDDELPDISEFSIGIFCGTHKIFSHKEIQIIDEFCEKYDAVVFCDHTSNYFGKYRINYSLVLSQEKFFSSRRVLDLLIHIGETSGDYYSLRLRGKKVFRVSEDGELRDLFRGLCCVFEMPESYFFSYYNKLRNTKSKSNSFRGYLEDTRNVNSCIPEIPFSNVWIAKLLSSVIPSNSVLHFGILNSLRAWNFFEISNVKSTSCNVGGFGIDGALSTFLGASLSDTETIHFLITGDLAFFYDMNSLGNRYVHNNMRILLINNGKGNEFRLYWHPAAQFGEETDKFVGGGGHYGNKSVRLVKDYVENLGFQYLSADNKDEFMKKYPLFVDLHSKRPILFEVFTTTEDENEAIRLIRNCFSEGYIKHQMFKAVKKAGKVVLSNSTVDKIKNIIK